MFKQVPISMPSISIVVYCFCTISSVVAILRQPFPHTRILSQPSLSRVSINSPDRCGICQLSCQTALLNPWWIGRRVIFASLPCLVSS
ncbi:hypothetical protein NOF04DRAFT_1330485 [Fusarium oxysporum II5]|nr:hypothetical protein NOF04DRAFT_1330485 [Fusarium oxysporum II5]